MVRAQQGGVKPPGPGRMSYWMTMAGRNQDIRSGPEQTSDINRACAPRGLQEARVDYLVAAAVLAGAGAAALNATAGPAVNPLRHKASCSVMPGPISICGSDAVSLSRCSHCLISPLACLNATTKSGVWFNASTSHALPK